MRCNCGRDKDGDHEYSPLLELVTQFSSDHFATTVETTSVLGLNVDSNGHNWAARKNRRHEVGWVFIFGRHEV